MTDERERLSWDDFGVATRDISRAIVADGFRPEVVVAIARGGLLPGGAIAYGLGVKNCGALNVEFYTGVGTVLDAPEVLPPALDLSYLEGRRVLLVDDVADSGRTLDLAVKLLYRHCAEARSAADASRHGDETKAMRAAATAPSTSASPALPTAPSSSPLAGDRTSSRPVPGVSGAHFPAT